MSNASAILERLLERSKQVASVQKLRLDPSVRADLKALGVTCAADFLRVMKAAKRESWFLADVATMQEIAKDKRLAKQVAGCALSDQLLHMLSFASLRARVTRRFLHEFDRMPMEEAFDAYFGADALAAAIESNLLTVRRFVSVKQFVRLVKEARTILQSNAYRFPQPRGFTLPEGWRWFESGSDFQTLVHYSADYPPHKVEDCHYSVSRGDLFLLRDNHGQAWQLQRLLPPID